MGRPKKQPAAGDDGDNIFSLKTSELLWMRDKFISGLSNLESGVHELRRAYISHFNTLLPEGHPGRLSLPFFTSFGDNATTTTLGQQPVPMAGTMSMDTAAPAETGDAGTKKKRKAHDKKAPKRALTSYFLFMQHNKPQIKEMNPNWDAKAVAEESERRWNNISEPDKQKYEYMYQVDLARYYKQKELYEAGQPVVDIGPEEATRIYNEHLSTGKPFPGRKGKKFEGFAAPTTDNEATGEHDNEDDADGTSDDESEEEQAPPPKAAKRQKKEEPKAAPKQTASASKKAQAAHAQAQALAESQLAQAQLMPPAAASTEKKKTGRKSKNSEPAAEEGQKKTRKRKSAAE